MCGIVGYTGKQRAVDVVVEGLRRLEYRGYDSAGIAVQHADRIQIKKRAGKLANLTEAIAAEAELDGSTGIGHTRWATHGAPTDRNAHPHTSTDGALAVIHNGTIENFAALRRELETGGVRFTSDTDTECVAHLLAEAYAGLEDQRPDRLAEAMRRVCQRLDGAFTLLAVHAGQPGVVVGARRNSPLVAGRGDGENFLASDVSAFIEHTREAVEFGQDQVVEVTPEKIVITDFFGAPATGTDYHVDWDAAAAEKGGYDYFMLKEIAGQPQAVADTLRGRLTDTGEVVLDDMHMSPRQLRDIDKVFVIGCGTSYHAGLIAKYAFEHWTRVPVEVELASEFRYRDPVLGPNTLVVVISQSGETMDTIMALRHASEQKAPVLAICNTIGSTIPRESTAVLYTHAGPETAVASTKAFLTQVTAVYLVGLYLAQARGVLFDDEVSHVVSQLRGTPDKIAHVLDMMEPVRALAESLRDARQVLFLGRHVGYPVALEGALKLKELAYMHAEGFAAGELKHGPISLIEEGTVVVVTVPSPRGRSVLHDKIVSNIAEVRARGARTVVIAEVGDEVVVPYADDLIVVPHVPTLLAPLVTTVPLQVLACGIAAARGNDVDQPRNLAKSVTVE